MITKQPFIAYATGVAIGFSMLASFVFGYRVLFSDNAVFGSILITIGLLLYPVYIALIVTLSIVFKERWTNELKKQWRYSIFMVPLGAIVFVVFMVIGYMILG